MFLGANFLQPLAIATFCGIILGLDRERRQKAAGIRTITMITSGAALFTCIAFYINSNVTQILSYVISGVGFLGTGTIIRVSDKVSGLTTAAMIWVASGIGILCGMGFILLPIILTFGIITILYLLSVMEKFIH